MKKTFIIAEAGVNHNGDPDLAIKLIDAASNAGADAVKFQIFNPENIATKDASKASYQKVLTDKKESQLNMLRNLVLPNQTYKDLAAYAKERNIEFLCTAFDMQSLDFLVNSVGVEKLKIPSGEITNGPFLLSHALTKKQLIVSTGMTTINEIKEALSVIAFGYIDETKGCIPTNNDFNEAYASKSGQKILKEKVTLLHCTSEYPAPLNEVNLKAMNTISDTFGMNIGYSDHTEGINVSIAAVAMGAKVIEKHFTLDKTLSGPDHKASLEPDELTEMILSIRELEEIMGNGLKKPTSSEFKNRSVARKSLVANTRIRKGEKFTEKNLTAKRPGIGLSPMDYWLKIGEESSENYSPDDLIR
jgi:N-acetylneuraminate synthase